MTGERLPGGRTHMCGALRAADAGSAVVLAGWVARRRHHGGVVFLDLRDREGVVQVVVHPEDAPEAFAAASEVRLESVVRVEGEVRLRPEGTANPNLPTGEVEVAAARIEVLSPADPPPFPVEDRVEAEESVRLRYRYLDLRRPEMTRLIRLRHQVTRSIRAFFDERGFVEVETPALTKSTPEGARDFLVPSRLQRGKVYALPQSPQQFKQLLMVAGLDRYYQIARCFRDEDPRADRQFEFTQLDVELSFATEEDVFELVEAMFARLMREVLGVEVATPFPRMPYDQAVARYGTDKPDTRYGLELADLSAAFAGTAFRAFASALEGGGVVKALAVPGAAGWARKELDRLVEEAKARGARGLVWVAFVGSEVRSSAGRHLSEEELRAVREGTGVREGDLVLLVADQPARAAVALDGLRRLLAARLGLVPEGRWDFVWVTEPPLFEWGQEEGKWVSVHHPFTAPAGEDLDPRTARARAYDLVLNGYELGGGSIRIHRPDLQRKVFEVLGLSPEQTEAQFGHLLEAFRYGVPPHGGIALGLDRTVMVLAGRETIRDVIAFPKTQLGTELLTGAPSEPTPEQLEALGIRFVDEPEEAPAGRAEGRG
ncbi:MAG TPA: aspartate--tRNA ligase [Actinomycetota bacterium]|nr:aspartate--tRNA ligase [Actinomycetota bacterium]